MSTSTGLTALKRRMKGFLCRHEALILTYHSILPAGTALFPIAHHLDGALFEGQMRYLAEEGFNCVSLEQLARYIADKRIPPRTVVLTFDDGFYNNYSVAFPILQRYNIPATIFLATGFVGGSKLAWPERVALLLMLNRRPTLTVNGAVFNVQSQDDRMAAYTAIGRHFGTIGPDEIETVLADLLQQAGLTLDELYASELYQALRFMDWSQVAELARSGLINFGSHTVNHRRLIYLSPEDAQREIETSRQMIREQVGECTLFAYPHGRRDKDFNESHASMARQAGYQVILTADNGSVNRDADAGDLPRVSILQGCDVDQFEYLLLGGAVFNQPVPAARKLRGVLTGTVS